MPQVETIKRVQPGQVISSALMNEILERLQKIGVGGSTGDLTSIQSELQALETWQKSADPQISAINKTLSDVEAKLMSLESASQVEGKVRISGFDPPTGAAIGTVMTILGDNFASDYPQNVVLIDNIPVYWFRLDTTINQLRFIVPQLSNMPASGSKDIVVCVSNTNGRAQASYKIFPAPTGAAPQITGITPDPLYIGEEFVVNGSNIGTQDTQWPHVNGIHIKFTITTKLGAIPYELREDALSTGYNAGAGKPLREVRGKVPDIIEINVTQEDKDATDVILEAISGNVPSAMRMVRVRRK